MAVKVTLGSFVATRRVLLLERFEYLSMQARNVSTHATLHVQIRQRNQAFASLCARGSRGMMASVRERKVAPAASIFSRMCSKSLRERESRVPIRAALRFVA